MMFARLAKVTYWTSYGLAILFILLTLLAALRVYFFMTGVVESDPNITWIIAGGVISALLALGCWLAGRALRFIFTSS